MLVGFSFLFFFPEIRQAKIKSLFESVLKRWFYVFPLGVIGHIVCAPYTNALLFT